MLLFLDGFSFSPFIGLGERNLGARIFVVDARLISSTKRLTPVSPGVRGGLISKSSSEPRFRLLFFLEEVEEELLFFPLVRNV